MDLEQATSSTHGHEIMRLVASMEGKGYTRDQLKQDVAKKFGAEARFYACAGDAMTFEGILEFLIGRGKIVETPAGLKTDLGQMCSHDEGEH